MAGRIFERPIFSTSMSNKYMPIRSCNKGNKKKNELTKTTIVFFQPSRQCGVMINRSFPKSSLGFNDEIFECGSLVPAIKPTACMCVVLYNEVNSTHVSIDRSL